MIARVDDLKLYYATDKGPVRAVDGISFELWEAKTLALVSESGCGKSSTAHAIVRVLPRNVHTYSGRVLYDGRDIMGLPDEEFRRSVRWRGISMVFQGAMNFLNPVMRRATRWPRPCGSTSGWGKGRPSP